MDKNFKIIIAGAGGQGLITLIKIVSEAALRQGLDVKTSELHGLSQRGGSVLTHIVLGKKVYSPLVERGEADLIVSLDILEALRAFIFGNKETFFLVNNFYLPVFGGNLKQEEIVAKLNEIAGKKMNLVPASKVCKEKLEKDVLAGVYLLGWACKNNLIPLGKEFFIGAIKDSMPPKYSDLNIKAFEIAYE